MEVLEVGTVFVAPDGRIPDRVHAFVRPTEGPQLTNFCKRRLTHMDQTTIDAAPSWPTVAAALAEFAQRHKQPGIRWVSWGSSDYWQVQQSARHGIVDPLAGLPHENFKRDFAKPRRKKIKQVGMGTVRQIVGLTP